MSYGAGTAIYAWAGIAQYLFLTLAVIVWAYDARRRRRARHFFHCGKCGYDLTGHVRVENKRAVLGEATRCNCPECGADLRVDDAVTSPSLEDTPGSRRDRLFAEGMFFAAAACWLTRGNLRADAEAEKWSQFGLSGSNWFHWLLVGSAASLMVWKLVKFVRPLPP